MVNLIFSEQHVGNVSLGCCNHLLHPFRPSKHHCIVEYGSGRVRVDVRGRTTVFVVALSVQVGGAGDAHGGAAVGHAVREFFDAGRFVFAGQAFLVVAALEEVALFVALAEVFQLLFDVGAVGVVA